MIPSFMNGVLNSITLKSENGWILVIGLFSDDQSAAIELLLKDEDNNVEHLSCNLNTWTYEQFKKNQGENSHELIRDLED